jgi:hypothetical protein
MKAPYIIFWKGLIATVLLFCHVFTFAQAPDIIWQKCLGGATDDYARSIQQTTDGGYIVAGTFSLWYVNMPGNNVDRNFGIVKLDANSNIAWQKSLGGIGVESASSIQQTSDGGYIVAGVSNSIDGDVTENHGWLDYWIVKLDANGNITWQKSLGGSGYDGASTIQQTADGGYIVAGVSNSIDGDVTGNHGHDDFWIVKLDANGLITWQKSLGGSSSDGISSIQQTVDGGYIAAGYSISIDGDLTGINNIGKYWIVKLDVNGNITWQKKLGGSGSDGANSIQQTADGGYIVAGLSDSNDGDVTGNHGMADFWIVRLDANGLIVWQKSLGGSSNDRANSIQQTSDGGYIVAGSSISNDGDVTGNHGSYDCWIIQLDANGNIAWQKSLGGSGADYTSDILETADGGYIAAGYSISIDGDVTGNHGLQDYWIVKLGKNTGVSTNPIFEDVLLYPNPNTGSFLVEGIQEEDYPLDIAVLDINGRAVYQQKYSSYQEQLTLDLQIPKGVYLLQLGNEKGVTHQKFVVE